ncbi:MAG TPA: restriction endonuclease [Methylomicrobium sp.]|nr:restriction endonuclease [Methylomicrobium sp.]
MSIPSYIQFIEPVLRFLADNQNGISAKLAYEYAANVLGLSDEERQQIVPSGTQPLYKNRAGWAHDRLKRAGLSSSPRRGFWLITAKGTTFVREHSGPFSEELIASIALVKPASLAENPETNDLSLVDDTSAAALASPDDRLSEALQELRKTAEDELLESLLAVSPTFFETIVLDLLYQMGYGISRADLQRVGGTGDGGIDGVISLDRLGLEKVYVQAKRWQGPVGSRELRDFYGALAGNKAKKGVFITTSVYTKDAVSYVNHVEGIVLIDGRRLAGLMIDYEVGVTSRTVKIPKIDSDYFDEESA